MKKSLLAILVLAAAAAAGCAALSQSPQQTVFGAKQSFDAALTTAVAYKRQPACSATVTTLCSRPEVVAQFARAGNAVEVTVNTAEAAVRDATLPASITTSAAAAAKSAVDAFVALVNHFGK